MIERFHFDFPKGCARAPIHEAMRSCIPLPGSDWKSTHEVVLEYGQHISIHSHPEWVAVYYEYPGNPPCALVIDNLRIEADRGDVFVIPPNVEHEVEESWSSRARVSYAIKVADG